MSTFPVSRRLLKVPASPIRKLVPFALEAEKKGKRILYFNIGDPDIRTPDVMIDVLKDWEKNPIPYSRSHGEQGLVEALVSYYSRLGADFIRGEDILVTTGGSEAISMALFSIADPGDEVIVFEPFYTNYNSYAAINGVTLVPVLTTGRNGFHLPEKAEVESKLTPKTRAILICNPNNPTGTSYTREEMDMLIGICRDNGLFLISDEVYREFNYDGRKHVSILDYMEAEPGRTVLLDSLSKRYSLCGARVGMLVSMNREIMDGVMRMAQGRLSAGYIDQKVAEKLTEVPDTYLDGNREEYRKRRDVLCEGLKAIPGVFLKKPEGAFYAIVKLPVKDSEKFCKWLLTDYALEGTSAFFAPASGFYATPGLGTDEIRIAYVLNSDLMTKAVEILKGGLLEYGKYENRIPL